MRLSRLVFRNVMGNLFRSSAIFLCAVLVAGLSLSATLVVRGTQGGLQRNLSRMGADIVVIPWGTMSQDFDGAHLVGMMTDRWMPMAYMERIRAVQGVELVTPQLYLATLPDSPYSSLPALYLVAYDPATDFVLKPWLEHDPIGILRLGEAVGGFAVSGTDGGPNIQIFEYPLKLVRTLEETGGDVDQVLFVSFDTAQALLEHVQAQPNPAFEIQPESISSAMVKVRLGSDPHDVAVRILEEVNSVIPIESTGFFQTQRSQMVGLLRIVLILTGLTWLLATLFMGFVFSLAANERRREVATIRALGATGKLVLKVLLLEGVLLAFSGGIMGLGAVVLGTGLLRGWISNLMNIDISLPPVLLLLGLVVLALTLTVLSVMVAAWIPTTRLSKQDLAIAMRE